MMKPPFIRIEHKRYRLFTIKRYEPFTQSVSEKYGIYIYFSAVNAKFRSVHLFNSETIRDDYMSELDYVFGLELQRTIP